MVDFQATGPAALPALVAVPLDNAAPDACPGPRRDRRVVSAHLNGEAETLACPKPAPNRVDGPLTDVALEQLVYGIRVVLVVVWIANEHSHDGGFLRVGAVVVSERYAPILESNDYTVDLNKRVLVFSVHGCHCTGHAAPTTCSRTLRGSIRLRHVQPHPPRGRPPRRRTRRQHKGRGHVVAGLIVRSVLDHADVAGRRRWPPSRPTGSR